MKKIFITSVIAAILLLSVGLSKNIFITAYIERAIHASTGLSLKIGGLSTAILKGRAEVKNMRLLNPPQFKDRVMLDLGHVYMDYDFGALLKRNIHLRELDIDLKEFMVVKDKNGELNLNSLKVVKHNKAPENKEDTPKRGVFKFEINRLGLKIGRVVYKDYTHGNEPRIKIYSIDMDEVFTDIDDIHNLISLVMLKALSKTDIGLLAGFNLELLKAGVVGKSIVTAEKVTNRVYQDAKKVLRFPFKALKSNPEKTGRNNVQGED